MAFRNPRRSTVRPIGDPAATTATDGHAPPDGPDQATDEVIGEVADPDDPFDPALAPRRSNLRRAVDRFVRNRLAVVGLVFIVLISLAAILAPWLTPYQVAVQDVPNRLQPPSASNWLGTDEFGRDMLTRVLFGARVSLAVGFASVALLVVIGVSVGIASGYFRRLDGPLMRLVDLFLSVPGLFLLLLLVALFGTGQRNTILFIAVTNWMATARLVRGQVLTLREREYVLASWSVGSGPWAAIRRHFLPNIADVVMVQATLTISLVILLEASLSFLGLGTQPPTPTWGNMLSSGRNYMRAAWWVTTFPGLAIFFTVMAFNFVGDGIRDALDRRMA